MRLRLRLLIVTVLAIGAGFAAAPSESSVSGRDRMLAYQAAFLDPEAATEGEASNTVAGTHRHQREPAAAALALAEPLAPSVGGSWAYGTPMSGSANPIHTVYGPDGKVLLIEGSGNRRSQFLAGTFRTYLWTPATGAYKPIATPDDMFCAGHVLLPDGRALVGGGTTGYSPFTGSDSLYAFNFTLERYEPLTDMEVGRWYPTLVNDWLGRTMILGGFDANGVQTRVTERFDYRTNALSVLPSQRSFPLYPQMYLTTAQRWFLAKPAQGGQPGFWDPNVANGYQSVRGFGSNRQVDGAASCFIGDVQDQRLMVMGGGWPATSATRVIDLKATTPSYTAGPPLRAPKGYVSCVTLPDGSLLEANGGTSNDAANASAEASILNATRTAWVAMNPLPAGEHRLYHSMLFVLDDGRVVSQTSNPKTGRWSTSVLVFSPPYLFKGTRPQFTSAPTTITYGGRYAVTATTPSSTFNRVTITTPPSPTHSTEPNQRYVSLPLVNGSITIPNSSSVLPPGKYRLWAVNAEGVPSVARWVTLS